MLDLLTTNDVHTIDKNVIAQGISQEDLISEVGKCLSNWFELNIPTNKKILILIGPGNNGSDGLALAHELQQKKYNVNYLYAPQSIESNIHELLIKKLKPQTQNLNFDFYDIIVDAIFGIGLSRNPENKYQKYISLANDSNSLKISIDVPSGINSDTGELFEIYFKAEKTLTISAPKVGLYLLPGNSICGEIITIKVNSIDEYLTKYNTSIKSLDNQNFLRKKILSKKGSHKYKNGITTFVMCESFPGASLLAANAAQRTGSGYIQIFAPHSYIKESQINYPHFVFKPYKKDNILDKLKKSNSNSFVIGPGWDLSEIDISKLLVNKTPTVLDGGILTPQLIDQLINLKITNAILTPHFGELQRMMDSNTCKWSLCKEFQRKTKSTLVAKGYDTIISNYENGVRVTSWNISSLATAGTGDILAGIIGSLLAQGLDVWDASCLGVDLHRKAAKRWPKKLTPNLLLDALSEEINTEL